MKKWHIVGLAAIIILIAGIVLAEQMTFSTYYPAPYGRYREFSTTGKTTLATDEFGIEGATALVGIGTTEPENKLHISQPGANIVKIERTGTWTNEFLVNNLLIKGTTNVSMQDGFGAGLKIVLEDSDGIENGIGEIGAIRDGADNQGALIFKTYNADVARERMRIDSSGNVGIGTTSPDSLLHVKGGAVRIEEQENRSTLYMFREDLSPQNNDILGDICFLGRDSNGNFNPYAYIRGYSENTAFATRKGRLDFIIMDVPAGYRTVLSLRPDGTIYQHTNIIHNPDYVFDESYSLETIEEHADYMWTNRRLKAIPGAEINEDGQQMLNIEGHRMGILEELEKAHIYITQLNERAKEQQKDMEELKEQVTILREAR